MCCPWPALRLARAMRSADAVRLLSDDPRAEGEAAALAAVHGWVLTVTREGPIWHIEARLSPVR
ncbi:MAG: sulfurtransferase TusA family protein [Sphingopyxis sp.]|nr:sulfurtransferase TusA family protein [Sphingopyxis sp.]